MADLRRNFSTPFDTSPILKALWRSVYWVSFPFGIIGFVLPIYGEALGASAFEIGGFFSAFSVIPVIVRPFLGRLLDRWGRRPFLLIGLSGYAVTMVLFLIADSVVMLTVARFVQGIGAAFLWITAYTIIADLAHETGRGREFGTIDEALNRGAILGTFIGFVIMFSMSNAGFGWRPIWFWMFAGYTLPALIGCWHGFRGVPETRPTSSDPLRRQRPVSRQLIALMMIVFITGASTAMVWPILVVFLRKNLNAEFWAIGSAYLPAALLNSFLPSRVGILADRLGRKKPMIVGLLIGAVASALIPSLRSVLALAILWSVETLGYIAAAPAERAYVADIAGEDVRGTSYGLYTFAYFLGAIFGPLMGGWLYDTRGYATPFYLNSVVLLVGAILVAAVLRETRMRKVAVPTSHA
ncbi:MAG: MFS transporter [Anaerolineales bacterium]|nr:MFS transporter [Anaerolineales bacterium]